MRVSSAFPCPSPVLPTSLSPFASTASASISASSPEALRGRFAWVHKRLGSPVRRRLIALSLERKQRHMTVVSGWDDESVLLDTMVAEASPVSESRRKRRAFTCSNDDGTGSNTKYGDTVDRCVC
jgi:hypothetical protein